jgi:hypothetical protein
MVDVFISYSRTDLAAVTRLAEAVEAEGYDVWWDADLPPHLSYGDVITNKIGDCKAAIVVWSKESAASEWVRAEADMARNQKKLIQVAIDNVMPPLPFNQIQYAELGDWQGEPDHPGWRKVKISLTELCRKTAKTRRSKPAATAADAAAAATAAAAPQPASALSGVPSGGAATSAGAMVPPKTPKGVIYGGIGALAVILALAVGLQLGGGSPAPAPVPAAPGQAQALAGAVPQAAAAPAAAATTASSASSDGLDRHVMVQNMSSQTLMQLYASPVTSDNWEEDMLGSQVLAAGASINANLDNGTNECNYDLKAVMADGKEYIHNAVNVCATSQWTIGDAGESTS